MDIHSETFDGQYPFERHYVEVDGVRLHYVDESPPDKPDAEPIVLMHGNPTWSYLYRNFIPPLVEAGYRAIAPDQIGYGPSDTPLDRSLYRLESRIEFFTKFMDKLDLEDITLVMQDWGGPIGLGYGVENPDRIKRLVIMSTWAFVSPEGGSEEQLPPLLQLCRKPGIGEVFLLSYNIFIEGFLPWAIIRKEKITPELMEAYRAPFPHYNSRIPTMAIQDVPVAEDHPSYGTMQGVQEKLTNLNVPTVLIWGEDDNILPPEVTEMWKLIYPHAEVHMVPRAGHFIQEDAPEEVVALIKEFLAKNP